MLTRVFHSFADLAGTPPAAVALGFFDGVHRGHRALVQTMLTTAASRNLHTVVLTFANHPATVVCPEAVPRLLTSPADRIRLLVELGADALCVAPFDSDLAQWSPRRFCEEILRDVVHTRLLVVGDHFALGRNRAGTVPVLKELGEELGFEVLPFTAVLWGDEVISSSAIRQLLCAGDVQRAARFLGRPFAVTGRHIRGTGQGRKLGFPTINLHVDETLLLPAPGIYAGKARMNDAWFPAAVYLGDCPTFARTASSFEVHLLDPPDMPPPSTLTVQFHHRIREDRRFPTTAALTEQIRRDVVHIRKLLMTVETGPDDPPGCGKRDCEPLHAGGCMVD